MCVSGDGATVLVVLHCSDVFVWQLRPGVTIFDAAPADIAGCWSRVGCDDDRTLPGGGQTEACVHAVFCINDRCVSNAMRSKAVLIEEFCNEERGSRMLVSQSREPRFESTLLLFRSLGIFVLPMMPQFTELYICLRCSEMGPITIVIVMCYTLSCNRNQLACVCVIMTIYSDSITPDYKQS